jgi:hypothetical protein
MEDPMSEQKPAGMSIRAAMGDVTNSQVAVGTGIEQKQAREAPTEAELRSLIEMLAGIRAQVALEAPPEQQQAAAAKVAELAEALAQPEPDLATMESVRNWFVRRLPALAGGITSLIVHPIVGKLVGAAGDALAGEFQRRFPH